MSERNVSEILLSVIVASPTNPRTIFDSAHIKELAGSIREHGVLQPILIRPRVGEDGLYEIVAGECRWRASQEAKMTTIPALVRNLTDREVYRIQIVENLNRRDIHELEEARALQRCLGDLAGAERAAAVKDLAKEIGKSEKYVYDRIKLLSLIEEAQADFLNYKETGFTAGHAILVARLEPGDQERTLTRLFWVEDRSWSADRGPKRNECALTVKELAQYIKDKFSTDLKNAPFDLADGNLLPKNMPACNACEKNLKGVCMLKSCFEKRKESFFKRRTKEIIEDHPELVPISVGYGARVAGTLPYSDFNLAKEGQEGAELAVIAAGNPQELGSLRWIIRTKGISPEEEAKRKAAREAKEARDKREAQVQTMVRKTVFEGCLSLGVEPAPELFRAIALRFWGNVYGDVQKHIAKKLGWKGKLTNELAREKIMEAKIGEVLTIIVHMVGNTDLTVHSYWMDSASSRELPKPLAILAGLANVDVDLLRREAEEKYPEKSGQRVLAEVAASA